MEFHRTVKESFWWDVATSCDYATFFHSPLWHRLISSTYDAFEDRSVGATTDEGVRLVLPLLQTGTAARGMMQNLISTFAGCYGGVIANGPVSHDDLDEFYSRVRSWDVAELQVNGNPLWENAGRLDGIANSDATVDFTHVLSLENKSFEDITSGFTDGHRSGMHKGERMGVTVRVATSIEDFRAYFGAYEDCLRRWDNPTSEYGWELFENGHQLTQEHPKNLRLWLAEVDGEVIAGAWFFYWNRHVDYWHAASYEEYFDHRPNNVLLPHVMQDAIERGFYFFDFNPSGGHKGVARFKKHFGAEKWPVHRWKLSNQKLDLVRKARRKLQGEA